MRQKNITTRSPALGKNTTGWHLRRARGRARLGAVLPLPRLRLRVVQPFPRADRAHRRGAGGRVGVFEEGGQALPRVHHEPQEEGQEERLNIIDTWYICSVWAFFFFLTRQPDNILRVIDY